MATVYSRLYERLNDLIPQIEATKYDSVLFATSRHKDDLSIFCEILVNPDKTLTVQIAHDKISDGNAHPAPWMEFKVSPTSLSAELLTIQDEWCDQILYDRHNTTTSTHQRAAKNILALNWLTTILNQQMVFKPVVSPALFA